MKYRVTGQVTISVSVVVEATSKAQARRFASDAPMQQFCYHCSNGKDGVWCAEELDGEPKITGVIEP